MSERTDRPLIVALDFPDEQQALAMVALLDPARCRVKVGKELFTRCGPPIVERLVRDGFDVFLDLKFHDIPNTVAAACAAAADLGCWMINVHASGGRAMMEDAKAAANGNTKIVGVTLLTSLDERDMGRIGYSGTPHDQVERLAGLAQEAGLDGIVCSGNEVKAAHKIWKDGFFVVPGLRPKGGALGDQKRAVTPAQARDNGASVLVIGRPITGAEDPNAAARAIEATL